jgi:MFS family permease
MAQSSPVHGMRSFVVLWLGQVVSLLGSSLTSFALGVFVYQRTGSATLFAFILLTTTLPGIVFAPLAGALVDRWNRRSAMLLSDCVAGLSTLAVALLILTGRFEIWHIYLATAVSSLFGAFRWPALSASITLLVPKQQLGRANGMIQLAYAIVQIISPVLGAVLLVQIEIRGLVLFDFATFVFAVLTLLSIHIPKPAVTAEGAARKGTLVQEALAGWTYITARPGLLGLLILYAIANFYIGIIQVLITPMVLGFTSVETLGTILSIAGAGMLIGSVLMSIWGGPKRRIYGIISGGLLQGLALLVGGLQPSVPLIAAAAFAFLFTSPIILGCSQTIWQSKVAPDLQGRVFALRTAIASSSVPFAYLVAGPLADRVFNPWLVANGPLAASVGQIIGVGPGRGIGLLFIILGLFSLLVAVVAYLYRHIRLVEQELPDVVVEEAAARDADTRPEQLNYPQLEGLSE